MSAREIAVTLTYTEAEAREVARALEYFNSNVSATYEDRDRLNLIRSVINRSLPLKEPKNPAARVTDRRENIWRLLADGDWVCTSGPDIGEYIAWDRLAAERGPLEVSTR